MIHGFEAKLSGKAHSHDIDYSEEERRLIEEQSQRLETWKKSPIGILHTMKELQDVPQLEEYTMNITKPSASPVGETLSSQPLQDGTKSIVFPPPTKGPSQQEESSVVKDFGTQGNDKNYFKNLNKEELEMLHSLMKKLDLHQLQSETAATGAGGVSSDETISAHTTSSLPPSDTEGTLSTASEPTAQLASPIPTASEPHPSESQSPVSSATSPDVDPSLQLTTEGTTQQDAMNSDAAATSEKAGEEEHQHDDSEGAAFTPGMMTTPNPMAVMTTMGPFIPPAAAAGFMPTMLPAPISPYMIPPQAVYYYHMLQHAHYSQMLQHSMQAAAMNSPTVLSNNQEDGHFLYQQKNVDTTNAAVLHDVHHQGDVNVDPVEVTANTDHPNDEQLRGNSPLQDEADFTSSQCGFPASTVPPVNLHLDQTVQSVSMAPSSFTGTTPIVLDSLHSSNEDNTTSSGSSQLQFTTEDNQIANPNKDLLKALPAEAPVPPKTEPVSTNRINHASRREPLKNYSNHSNNGSAATGSGKTNTSHLLKQPQSTKQNKRPSSNLQQQTQHRTTTSSRYDGDVIDHELSQMGLHNSFPDGIPSMVFSSSDSKRRKVQ